MVTAYQPVDELIPLALAAEEAGFRAFSLADHVVDLEELATPYPYTADGSRRWATDVDWPDPWVTVGALAAVTERLQFFTSVYVAALRDPFSVAKAVGTASALSAGRVTLGVGVGWCREEFDLLGQDFSTRGRRTDEGLALMKQLWEPAGPSSPASSTRASDWSCGPIRPARSRSGSEGSPTWRCAVRPATTAGSVTWRRSTRRSRSPGPCAPCGRRPASTPVRRTTSLRRSPTR